MEAAAAAKLVQFAAMTRNLKGNGLQEGASTRLLVHAAKLMVIGIEPHAACQSAIAETLTDDPTCCWRSTNLVLRCSEQSDADSDHTMHTEDRPPSAVFHRRQVT